ncbi:hypothetical protein RJ639_035744 [Escallonia herrerae]|uniref:NPH3 domain-containing protein n=1 Tax=Escallonia herrerae TaxID=1293975 RepID=A0AA88WP20_9ASTE|nr:hypothetical protein RJ639_035744 [Escallonia herrerae]
MKKLVGAAAEAVMVVAIMLICHLCCLLRKRRRGHRRRPGFYSDASEECKAALEKKIGSQLEQATLCDLLIPSYSYLNETLYDVDCVERILGYFLDGFEVRSASRIEGEDENSGVRSAALMLVLKLIDEYLSEIASNANLKPEKFYKLAVALPDHARLFYNAMQMCDLDGVRKTESMVWSGQQDDHEEWERRDTELPPPHLLAEEDDDAGIDTAKGTEKHGVSITCSSCTIQKQSSFLMREKAGS